MNRTDDRAAERAAYIAAFTEAITAANGKDPDFTLAWAKRLVVSSVRV